MKIAKTFIIALGLGLFVGKVFAQDKPHVKLLVGLNVINNNSKSQMPWAIAALDFKTPLTLGIDYQVTNKWSFGVNSTFNKLEVSGLTSNFYAIHADANYYIIPNTPRDYKELYISFGGGFYQAFNNTTITLSPGMGINYWFLTNWAVNVSAKANVGVKNKVHEVGSYYQANLGLIWRLGDQFNNK